jgi:hypothetical protein
MEGIHILRLWERLFTRNLKAIPLLWVTFNQKYYKEFGDKGSCTLHIHPELKDDERIKETLNELVDYIRVNYDMKDM